MSSVILLDAQVSWHTSTTVHQGCRHIRRSKLRSVCAATVHYGSARRTVVHIASSLFITLVTVLVLIPSALYVGVQLLSASTGKMFTGYRRRAVSAIMCVVLSARMACLVCAVEFKCFVVEHLGS